MKMIYQKPEIEVLLMMSAPVLQDASDGNSTPETEMSNIGEIFDKGEIPNNSSSSLWED